MFKRNFLVIILLIVLTATPCFAEDAKQGSITGKWITKDKGPMTGAQVLLFNAASGPAPSSDKHLRIPDAGTAVDSEGKFSVEVPAGKYYLVMRKRVNPESAGPPDDGDPQYYARLKNGQPKKFVIKSGKTTNIGTVSVSVPFRRARAASTKGFTGIEGIITDEKGAPVSGVRVLAYDSLNMRGRPLYASDKTGTDGRYFLNVTLQGVYYLKARTHYGGGKPVDGEFVGVFGKTEAPESLAVDNGKICKGIDISVERFIDRRKPERPDRRRQPSTPSNL